MITIERNPALGLHVVKFSSDVTPAQFIAAFEAIGREPDWARADTIHIVEENIRLHHDNATALLDELRAINRRIFLPLDIYLVRRAAWICHAPAIWPLIQYWLKDRHSRDGLQSEFCAGTHLDVARQLFEEAEVAAVASGEGFQLLATFT